MKSIAGCLGRVLLLGGEQPSLELVGPEVCIKMFHSGNVAWPRWSLILIFTCIGSSALVKARHAHIKSNRRTRNHLGRMSVEGWRRRLRLPSCLKKTSTRFTRFIKCRNRDFEAEGDGNAW